MVLVAGTTGYLHGDYLKTSSAGRIEHRIHQSSISAMEYINPGNSCLVVTGGDDNALAVTLLNFSGNPTQGTTNIYGTGTRGQRQTALLDTAGYWSQRCS